MAFTDSKEPHIQSLSAVTLATTDMATEVTFFEMLGFAPSQGGRSAAFTSFHIGPRSLNLIVKRTRPADGFWGRVIFYVRDVDAYYRDIRSKGIETDFSPRDADWGERYFHLHTPAGHELSFATPLNAIPSKDVETRTSP